MAVSSWYNNTIVMNDYSPVHARSPDSYLKKLRKRRLLKGSLVVMAVVVVLVLSILLLLRLSVNSSSHEVSQQSIVELWGQQ